MYMTFREMQADTAHMTDALAVTTWVRDRLNTEHGGNFAASINIGGNPTLISLTSAWASLGDYEKARAAIAADEELQSVVRVSSGLVSNMQDSIAQIVKAPGERGAYAGVNTALMNMSSVVEAITFALEVADFIEAKNGNSIGVVSAVTGNRARMAWIGFFPSLDQFEKDTQALETDPDYLEFFKRSNELFVPSTLEQSIWQMLP